MRIEATELSVQYQLSDGCGNKLSIETYLDIAPEESTLHNKESIEKLRQELYSRFQIAVDQLIDFIEVDDI